MFILLKAKVIKLESMNEVSNFFLDNMAIFFIPAGVSLIKSLDLISDNVFVLLITIFISTIIVMYVTGKLVDIMINKKSQGELIMYNVFDTEIFGVILTILFFNIGIYIQKKTNKPIFNPLLIAILGIILFLSITKIPYESYKLGGDRINFFLGPVTIVLAVPLLQAV